MERSRRTKSISPETLGAALLFVGLLGELLRRVLTDSSPATRAEKPKHPDAIDVEGREVVEPLALEAGDDAGA